MEKESKSLFRWEPGPDALFAFGTGAIVVLLSLAMLPFKDPVWVNIVIRDLFQILFVGLLIPATYLVNSGSSPAEFGFTWRRWPLHLVINLVLGGLLLMLFLKNSPPANGFVINSTTLATAGYVFFALIFELVFFYGFLRTLFERAFGIVPAIVLTAALYSLHHIGFQPEFGKLFVVGLIYATAFRIGNSALTIFPFFLGIGGLYDVLIQSDKVTLPAYPGIRIMYLTVAFIGVIFYIMRGFRLREEAVKDILVGKK